MTNTEAQTGYDAYPAIAARAAARSQTALDNSLARLKEDPTHSYLLPRVWGRQARLDLDVAWRDEGLARAVTMATAWRDIIDNMAGSLADNMLVHARAKGARSWLYDNEQLILDMLVMGWGSRLDRESIISDLISGG